MMRSVILEDQSEFASLERAWEKLLDASKSENIFLTFDWLYVWWRHHGDGCKKLCLALVFENDELVGIAPLMRVREYGFTRLKFLSSPLADYEDFLIAGDEDKRSRVIGEIFDTLYKAKGWDVFHLHRLREDSLNFKSLCLITAKASPFWTSLTSHCEGAPFIHISENWEAYQARLKKKFITDTKRCAALLRQEVDYRFVELGSDEKTLQEILSDLINLHKERCLLARKRSVFEDIKTQAFFREVTLRLQKKGRLNVTYIQLNGSRPAVQLSFQFKKSLYYYMPTFSSAFKRFSVGRLLLFDLIEKAFIKGFNRFDFMLGEEAYKDKFQPQQASLYFLAAAPKTLRGIMAYGIFQHLNLVVKKLLRKRW